MSDLTNDRGVEGVAGGGAIWSAFHTSFDNIISLHNLFSAWREFKRGKSKREDILDFSLNLEKNIFGLHNELQTGVYAHGLYESFFVREPKLRHIHKASVCDRVLHQAIFRRLNSAFDSSFIYDSFSCRVGKGTHAGVRRLETFVRKITANGNHEGWALKCDVRRFFDNVRHDALETLLNRVVSDERTRQLLKQVIHSFDLGSGRGLPLGNVTSQLFANIYLNELDRFVKHELSETYYLRYCDDFLILRPEREYLYVALLLIRNFLYNTLSLDLHPQKVSIRKLRQGTDFLGYVVLPNYTVMRTKTKRRALKRVSRRNLTSYLGVCSHAYATQTGIKLKQIVSTKNKLAISM